MPTPPQALASSAYGQGGISSSSCRGDTGRKIPQPELFTRTTMGDRPRAGACEISGPVIWKPPSPHSTSGRRPVPICAPIAAGIAKPMEA